MDSMQSTALMENPERKSRPPVISFVGKSNSGKTTFLEKLIPEMKRRGFRIGVIKHDAHKFEIDHAGKDSYRLKHAGADIMLISSSAKVAMVKDSSEDIPLAALCGEFMKDVDIVFSEGYKRENTHKIEISRRENTTETICAAGECIAMVSDWNPPTETPTFDLDDVAGVADLIQRRFL